MRDSRPQQAARDDAATMTSSRPPGHIITFYSYKGGTGRSMALANIAWILACNRRRVLVIDWDLEAPGLHRYFRPFLIDKELGSSEGLIDLVVAYADHAIHPLDEAAKPDTEWYLPFADVTPYILSLNFEHFPEGGKIDFLPAGRQSSTYAISVNSFNWQNFYDRLGGGGFLEAVKLGLRADYDYVLIDSRTGVSDTAGICTVQMPDTLAVCFTYNNQSISGAAAVARSSALMRQKLIDEVLQRPAGMGEPGAMKLPITPRPYRVFPIPMRVEPGESDRLAVRQNYARHAFADLAAHLGASISSYWSQVEVPYNAYYAYEEVLAPFRDDPSDPKKILAAFVRATGFLTDKAVTDFRFPVAPEVKQRYLAAFAETPQPDLEATQTQLVVETDIEAHVRRAEAALAEMAEGRQKLVRRVLLRMVKVASREEGGAYFAVRTGFRDCSAEEIGVIEELARRQVVCLDDVMNDTAMDGGHRGVTIADERLLRGWPRLSRWIEEDRDFLLWRQQLRDSLVYWERSGREADLLLSGSAMSEAETWRLRRAEDLNGAEQAYIVAGQTARSQRHATLEVGQSAPRATAAPLPAASRRGKAWLVLAAGIVVVIAGALLALQYGANKPAPADPSGAIALVSPAADRDAITRIIKLGDAEAAAGNTAGALQHYTQAIDRDPDNADALVKRGAIFDQLGDFSQAANDYDSAIRRKPDVASSYFNRGVSRTSQGNLTGAIADYDQAIKLDPNNPLYYFNRGVVYENARQPELAIENYTQAAHLKSDYIDAYTNRARLYEQQKQPQRAIADYQSVLKLAQDPDTLRAAQVQLDRLLPQSTAKKLGEVVLPLMLVEGQRVFIQYNDPQDAATAAELRNLIGAQLKGVKVAPPELVSARTDGDVRYFFPDDVALAMRTKTSVELALAKQGMTIDLKLQYRDAKDLPKARKQTVEVWLPSLSRRLPVRQQKQSAPASTDNYIRQSIIPAPR